MKHKLWLLHLPFIALFSFAFAIVHWSEQGTITSPFLRETVFPTLRTVSGMWTNLKFKARGAESPKSKVVIVDIDSESLEKIGRWPWHRDYMAFLVDKIFEAGAKVVGLDIVFSEPDQRIPDELRQLMQQKKMGQLIPEFETDLALQRAIERHKDKLVLGWMTEDACQPLYDAQCAGHAINPEVLATHPEHADKFALPAVKYASTFDPTKSPIMTLLTYISNLPEYNAAAKHAGTLVIAPDPDGYIRRTSLVFMGNGKPQPTLPLMMASVGLQDEINIDFDERMRVNDIRWKRSNQPIATNALGVMDVNFRGPSFSFPYVSAIQVMGDQDEVMTGANRQLASSKKDILKDAYVLVGLSAMGVFDMRAFPFDPNTPGVEGHATILDNLLNGDALKTSSNWGNGVLWLMILMVAVALAYALITERLESVPNLVLFAVLVGAFAWFDISILFSKYQTNWNTSFWYLEMFTIFAMTMAAKYIAEERNKKFIKGAFSKYVAPAIVDSIIKDPTKLTVGGEKRDLTILFSDIRSFTTMSEKMDARVLASFLNDYLGKMTDIVFDNSGTLDKYIGDAVMAFWGAPLDQKHHAINACKAAIAMMQKLKTLQPHFKEKFDVDVRVGVGINSGPVNVGNMGSERIFEYTVIGDHVNLASRLEGLTKHYGVQILTSRYTLDQIQAAGDTIPPHRILDDVKVKGKKQAIELVEIFERDVTQGPLKDGLQAFNEARQLYRQQKWDEAIKCFKLANDLLRRDGDPSDGPSEMYIERCEGFKQTPPNADWDGSWEMTSK